MTSTDKIDAFYRIRGSDFGFLERLEVSQLVDPECWQGLRVQIDLRSSPSANSRLLSIEFVGVRQLRVDPLEGIVRYMIEIRPIESPGSDGIHYSIVESEYNAFSFVCDDFKPQLD